jgi:hypothetical protein
VTTHRYKAICAEIRALVAAGDFDAATLLTGLALHKWPWMDRYFQPDRNPSFKLPA